MLTQNLITIALAIAIFGGFFALVLLWAKDAHDKKAAEVAVFAKRAFKFLADPTTDLITVESLKAAGLASEKYEAALIVFLLDNMGDFGHVTKEYENYVGFAGYGSFPVLVRSFDYAISVADLDTYISQNPVRS